MLLILPARLFAHEIAYETWMGTYVGDAKVGYLTYKIDQAENDGVKGYKISSTMNNRLTVLGAELTQLVTTTVYTDESFNPIREQFEMSSGGKTTTINAEFGKDRIECILSTSEGNSPKTVPIPPGAKIVGDSMFAVADSSREIGSSYTVHYFNPLTLTVDELKIKIERREKLSLGGKDYDTLVVTNSSPMGEITIWQDDQGGLLKVAAVAGIVMVRQDRDEALSGIKGSGEDFAVLTSVKTDADIPNPRSVKALDVVLKGISDNSMIISDSRQNAKALPESPGSVRYRVNAKTFQKKRAASLPVDRKRFAEDLSSSPYFDFELGGIRKQAGEIVGNEKNLHEACSRIRAWIYQNMQTRSDVGISRPASDVLKSRDGVCRDYAMLFVALARSAGIPSRIAAGITFMNGAFYYHAWVECWVGEWIPFDGTLPSDFVDATHIKLAQGGATSMFGLARVIGSLTAEVKGVK